MDRRSLYDDDIYAWARQQAEALRRLAEARRDLPNELDLENVAEEIADVGKSELNKVESFIQLIFIHLLKLASAPQARSRRKWRNEVLAYHAELLKELTPSMRQHVDVDHQWRLACLRAEGDLSDYGDELAPDLPRASPLLLADLAAEAFELDHAIERIRPSAPTAPRP